MSYSPGSLTMQYESNSAAREAHADYTQWSIEELWQLASQLRVSGARSKTRRELIDLFGATSRTAGRR
jgi:hypothetical protein